MDAQKARVQYYVAAVREYDRAYAVDRLNGIVNKLIRSGWQSNGDLVTLRLYPHGWRGLLWGRETIVLMQPMALWPEAARQFDVVEGEEIED